MGIRIAIITLVLFCFNASSFADATSRPSTQPIDLSGGWKLVKEDDADAIVDADATRSGENHLLEIILTKQAERGKGRAGAGKDLPIPIEKDRWYDISFSSQTERGSVGLVFELESTDGTVLARSTLPELGRRGGRGNNPSASTQPSFAKYSLALHARDNAPSARLVITPIEVTNIWLMDLTISPRD